MPDKVVRIGGSSGFWGDTATAAVQLVRTGDIQYLVNDYLAEVTMSIMAAQKLRQPDAGFARDFVSDVIAPLAREIAEKKIKVITNAGGINPLGCRDAVVKVLEAVGVKLQVAVVLGDDLMPRAQEFRDAGVGEMETGEKLPAKLVSMNAYLGGIPIARALDEGAEIVITGRCVDSAVTLGPLIHEFGWTAEDYDRLAMGSLAGHVIECGAQCNGGNFTDWQLVPDYDNIGFPVIECHADGTFVVGKPPGTGGLVSTATVAEQMLYEIGDPRAYMLPDVTADFTTARFEQLGENRVRVSGATGRPPTDSYKVSATWPDGFKLTAMFLLGGIDAAKKGRHSAEMILKRSRRLFRERNWGDFKDATIELLGSEATYGPHSRTLDAREVMVKIAAKHDQKEALALLGREIAPFSTGGIVGMSGSFGGGRQTPVPLIRLFSALVPKRLCPIEIDIDGRRIPVDHPAGGGFDTRSLPAEAPPLQPTAVPGLADSKETVRLVDVAYGRSGDKGDHANIGVFPRRPEWAALLDAEVTEDAVAKWFAHKVKGGVKRWRLPGIGGLNFLLRNALGGGGVTSLQADPQAKAYAQMLLSMPVRVPAEVAKELQSPSAA
jgi:hypothetical protein